MIISSLGTLVVVFLVTLIGTIFGVISGVGSSVVSLPVFLWIGIPLPLTIATHKLYCAFGSPLGAYNYLKGQKINWFFLITFAILGLIGAYFGVKFVLTVNENILKTIMGIAIVLFVIYSYFKKDFGLKKVKKISPIRKIISYPIALLMGFYESILGSGNGMIFAIVTSYSRGFDLISAFGYYLAVAFFWATFSAILYIQQGYFDFWIMLVAVLGAMIGTYIGSKYAKYKGNKFIKIFFIAIGTILGIKLILNL